MVGEQLRNSEEKLAAQMITPGVMPGAAVAIVFPAPPTGCSGGGGGAHMCLRIRLCHRRARKWNPLAASGQHQDHGTPTSHWHCFGIAGRWRRESHN